jgi:molecular chaperone IbpA
MRSSEYAPLFRSTVGFDRLFDMLENSVRNDWPPYDIEKKSEHEYRITMAIAGFSADEVELTQHGPELSVTGLKVSEQLDRDVLHRGLASRNFKQVFKLADYVKVVNASLENGLLSIELVREIPDELKPRNIAITSPARDAPVDSRNTEQISQDTKPHRKVA